jgi:hypothetical protein
MENRVTCSNAYPVDSLDWIREDMDSLEIPTCPEGDRDRPDHSSFPNLDPPITYAEEIRLALPTTHALAIR